MQRSFLHDGHPPDRNDGVSRRTFLKGGLAAIAATTLPSFSRAHTGKPPRERRLCFYNTHTGEHLSTCYFRNGRYRPQALAKINYLLRDHRTGDIVPIETELLDILHRLSGRMHLNDPFHVISGYRSPETNARLHSKNNGVASRSLHMYGKAIDLRVPGVRTSLLRKAAVRLKAGGVGYYPRSNFVHIDTGRVRCW